MRKSWPEMSKEQKIEFVKTTVLSGKSAREVSELVTGATRNAIIGFCHRNNLPLGKAAVSSFKSGRRPEKKKPQSPPAPRKPRPKAEVSKNITEPADTIVDVEPLPIEETPEIVIPSGVNFMELDKKTCRWPTTSSYKGLSPDEMRFCGADNRGKLYCPHHSRIAYQVPRG